MNLLAVDQGSKKLGLAFFVDGRVVWTRRVSAPEGWPWRRRMRFITDHVREQLVARAEAVDVVAIEDVTLGLSAKVAVTMGEQRGWLMCALEYWYPHVAQVAIHPATVRAAVQAPRSRNGALDRYRRVAEHALGGTKVSDDEAAAICIGLAALERIRREAQLSAAGVQQQPSLEVAR